MKIETGTLPDWIQVLFILVGGAYALFLLYRSNKENRSKLMLEMLDRFFSDSAISTILYSVDQGRDVEQIRHLGTLEQEADKTLKYIDYLGRLLSNGSLKKKDVLILKYEIKRILASQAVQEYIDWLRGIGVSLDYLHKFKFLMTK